jgi:hypothetical protein
MFHVKHFGTIKEEGNTGSRRGGAANNLAIDTQRAPVHSSSCGALLRLYEAICDLCRFSVRANIRLAFAALSHVDITFSAVAFRRGRHFRLLRHRDPAPVGVSYTVPVESSPLHCIWNRCVVERRHLPLPTGSCEQRRKHSNVALLQRVCQFFFAIFCGQFVAPERHLL